jgi:hypothetical protein
MDTPPQRRSPNYTKIIIEVLGIAGILSFVTNQISSVIILPLTVNLSILVAVVLIALTFEFISETIPRKPNARTSEHPGRKSIVKLLPAIFVAVIFITGVVSIGIFKFGWFNIFFIQPNPIISLQDADVNGWLIVQVHTRGVPRSLIIVDPRTGSSAPLWPSSQELNAPKLTLPYNSFTDPSYSPDSRKMALVGHRNDGSSVALVASISIGSNGFPVINGAPKEVATICSQCGNPDNIISLSKSGQWIIYHGANGLYAISTVNFETLHITPSPTDVWPACSPDGNWLAYEGGTHSIIALPATDCIPDKAKLNRARYLNGTVYSWSPQWSPDSQKMAFVSNYSSAWRLYEVSLNAMGTSNNPSEFDQINRIGTSDCRFAAWAETNQQKQNLLVLSCDKDSVTSEVLDIEPDGTHRIAELNANGVSWEKSIWMQGFNP